jgi:hypothetical protein
MSLKMVMKTGTKGKKRAHAVIPLNGMLWQDKRTVLDSAFFPAPNAWNNMAETRHAVRRPKSWFSGRAAFPVVVCRF